MIEVIEITATTDEAQMSKLMRKAVGPDLAALVIHGDLAAPVGDGNLYLRWIEQMIEAPIPVGLALKGKIGQRGLALVLAADIAFFGADATFADNAGELPGLAALALEASGPSLARGLLLRGGEPREELMREGLLRPAERPLEAASIWANAAALGNLGNARRAIRAARRLPLREALEFDIWLARPSAQESSS